MWEIESQDRQSVALRVGHHRRVSEAEVKISESLIDGGGAPQERGGQERHLMFSGDERRKEKPSRFSSHTRSEEVVCFDDDRIGDD